MTKTEIKAVMKKFLVKNFQMVIATGGKHPWIATVYYSSDQDLNIFFLSDPDTLHCRQIAKNPHVAVSVAESPQNPDSKKKGLQIYGLAELISDKHKIIHALTLWRKTLGVTGRAYTYQGMLKKTIKGRMYKVTPKIIKFYNEELWDEGDEQIINL